MMALAVYGTLAPGEPNHWVVSRLKGTWTAGTVRGYTFDVTWGPADGYPGFIADPDGSVVAVQVLQSEGLERHIHEIDNFEGLGYERLPIDVTLVDGQQISAQIYVTLTEV